MKSTKERSRLAPFLDWVPAIDVVVFVATAKDGIRAQGLEDRR